MNSIPEGFRIASGFVDVDVDVSKVDSGLARAAAAIRQLDSPLQRFSRNVRQVSREAGDALSGIGKKMILTQVLGTATTAALGLGNALAPIAGIAGAAAPAMLAMGQAGVVVKLAFEDVTAAALGVERQVNTLHRVARAGLLPGVQQGLRELLPIFDTVTQGIFDTGQALGRVAAEGGRLVATWGQDIETLMTTNARVIEDFGMAGLDLLAIFKDIAVTASPMLEDIAAGVRKITGDMRAWVAQARESGQLTAFFERAQEVAGQLGRIIGNLGETIAGVFRATGDLGRGVLDAIEGVTDSLSNWVNGPAGQEAIRQFSNMLLDLGPRLGELAGQVGRIFGELAQAGGGLSGTVDVLASLARTIANVLENNPGLAAFVGHMAVLVGVAKALKLGSIVSGFSGLARALIGLPETLGNVSAKFTAIKNSAGGLRGAIGRGALGLVGGFGAIGIAIAGAILVFDQFIAKQQEARARVDSLRQTLDQQTGAITENTRQAAAKILQDEGLLDAAQRLGLELPLVTDAYLGNDAALRQLTSQTQSLTTEEHAALGAAEGLGNVLTDQEADARFLMDGLTALRGEVDLAAQAQRQEAAATRDASTATRDRTAAIQQYTDTLRAQVDPVFAVVNANSQLEEAQRKVAEAARDSGAGSREHKAALDAEAQAAIDLLGAAGELAGGFTGRLSDAQRQALRDAGASEAAIRNLDARMAEAGAQANELTGDLNAIPGDVHTEITNTAPHAQDLAVRYNSQLSRLPPGVDTRITNNADAASGPVRSYRGELRSIPRNITTFIDIIKRSRGPVSGGFAAGGPVRRGQVALVGEEGPELVQFQSAGNVIPADETARIMRGSTRADRAHPADLDHATPGTSTTFNFAAGAIVLDASKLKGVRELEQLMRDIQSAARSVRPAGARSAALVGVS